jgi:hypothetical protein
MPKKADKHGWKMVLALFYPSLTFLPLDQMIGDIGGKA